MLSLLRAWVQFLVVGTEILQAGCLGQKKKKTPKRPLQTKQEGDLAYCGPWGHKESDMTE